MGESEAVAFDADDAEVASGLATIRPTKKQQQLLVFIEDFIRQHGYSPSYREIMQGCDYTSVATVSLHVNNLIKRGHIRKRDKSARSLEVVTATVVPQATTSVADRQVAAWLMQKLEASFASIEQATTLEADTLARLQTALVSLEFFGMDELAETYQPRLTDLQEQLAADTPDDV